MVAVCPVAAEWAECTKSLGAAAAPLNYAGRTNRAWAECTKPQSDRKENEGRSEKSGRPFCFLGVHRAMHGAEPKAKSRAEQFKRRRVAVKAPRAVDAWGRTGSQPFRAGLNCAAPTELSVI